jgi:hypothetical protein
MDGSGRGLFWGTTSAMVRKARNISIRIAGLRAEIWTWEMGRKLRIAEGNG